jgi:alpha-tubulin suppressor-like RCC1 family protein
MTARPVDAAGLPLAVPCVWTTTAAAVAKVTSVGQLSALSPGSATIRATCGGVFGEATVTVVSVPSNLVFISISAGGQTRCGLTAVGKAYCWGSNRSGELGTGTTTGPQSCTGDPCSSTPVAVAGGLTFTQLRAGPANTCGVASGGTGYCWGDGYYNQTGISPTSPWTESLPTEIIGGLTFQTVRAGFRHNCGLTALGAAYCWGENTFGQLGNGAQGIDSAAGAKPHPVVGGLTFSMISVGSGQSSCGVTTTGAAYCWGSNRDAQLGIDTAVVPQQCSGNWCWSPTPVAVQGGLAFASVSAGQNHNCGVTTVGAAYCWGGNSDGELGIGTTSGPEQCTIDIYGTFACSQAPVAVAGGLRFASVSAGSGYTCGLTPAGAAYCWGYLYGPTPVALAGGLTFVSLDHTCGITTSGVSYCWGDNTVGQLGDGTTASSSVPVKVAGQP